MLKTFTMVIFGFQVKNKLDKILFFKELFLLADTSINMVLKLLFLIFNNVNI